MVLEDNILLRVKDLRTYFFLREGTLRAIDGLSFDVIQGKTIGIAGESGCGKTVTAQSILRIIPKPGRIVSGEILLRLNDQTIDLVKLDPKGNEIRNIRGKEIAMIFQEPMTAFSPIYTIGNQIIEAIKLHQPSLSTREAKEQVLKMLEMVGMPKPSEVIDSYPFNLSGGMRQRAMVTMALSCHPRLLIADEPTTAVDVTIQAQVLELIKKLQQELGLSLMLITHDLAVIAEVADSVMIMYLGRQVEYAPVDKLFANPKHPYTEALLASIPKLGKESQKKIEPIAGSVPSLYEVPAGCSFHPRCPQFMSGVCDREVPRSTEVEKNHQVNCFLYQ
jgi:peptide/nickel transport system ATP-binding protein